jgi:hypothetical protein
MIATSTEYKHVIIMFSLSLAILDFKFWILIGFQNLQFKIAMT